MPASNLQDLARQFCEAVGVDAPPELAPDDDGFLAFSVQVRGVDLTVRHNPSQDRDHVLVHLVFGAVPDDREGPILRELLHANLAMLGSYAPAFSRNPLTGHILLQYVCPMSTASGTGLWQSVQGLVDTVLKWREDFALDAAQTPP